MEEQTTPSPEYLKGFNESYLLAREMPELADKLASVKGQSDRVRGLLDGYRSYILEKAKEQRLGRSKDSSINKLQPKEKSHGMDKDVDYEP